MKQNKKYTETKLDSIYVDLAAGELFNESTFTWDYLSWRDELKKMARELVQLLWR